MSDIREKQYARDSENISGTYITDPKTPISHNTSTKKHQDEDMEVMILQTGLQTKEEREYHEDKWICLLQTLQPDGINRDTHQYAKDMYKCYERINFREWFRNCMA